MNAMQELVQLVPVLDAVQVLVLFGEDARVHLQDAVFVVQVDEYLIVKGMEVTFLFRRWIAIFKLFFIFSIFLNKIFNVFL